MSIGNTLITTRPRSVGRDIGPNEKYRKGIWVKAILEHGDYTQSDGLPHYRQVFVNYSSSIFSGEPLDESEEAVDESSVEAEVEVDDNSNTKESIDVPDYTTRYSERDRLKTFGPWKQSFHATPLDLARNGFIYRGPADRVTCVFCRKILYKWEEGDVVKEEHRRISPNCPFVNGERNHLNKAISSADSMGNFGVNLKFHTKHSAYPHFQDAQLRKETFVNWHNISQFSLESLSEAGFFYTGKGDRVTCHQCGVDIDQWEAGNNPWMRHAQQSPRCDFLLHATLPASALKA